MTKRFLCFSRLRRNDVETSIYGARVSFRPPFTPNSLFASMLPRTVWVGAPKLTLFPDTGNPRYATPLPGKQPYL